MEKPASYDSGIDTDAEETQNPSIIPHRNSLGKLESVEVLLNNPITAYGKAADRIIMKAPKGKDRIAIGNPYMMMNGGFDIMQDRIVRYASSLSKTPRPLFDDMDMEDLDNIQEAVLLFFGEKLKAGASLNPSSTT